MGRPPRHDADQLLDAAVQIVAERGPTAVTMSAVAKEAGAPSGSLYHRFADRPALLAALWMRTQERFHEGLLDALRGDDPGQAAVAAGTHVVRWCREHPEQAAVLLCGPRDLGQAEWAEPDRRRWEAGNRRVFTEVRALADRLALRTRIEVSRLELAVVGLPYAVTRQHLLSGKGIPAWAVDLVEDSVRRLIAD